MEHRHVLRAYSGVLDHSCLTFGRVNIFSHGDRMSRVRLSAMSRSGEFMLLGLSTNQVFCLDLLNGRHSTLCLRAAATASMVALGVAELSDRSLGIVATQSTDRTCEVRFYDLATRECISQSVEHSQPIRGLQTSVSCPTLMLSSAPDQCVLWDLSLMRPIKRFVPESGIRCCMLLESSSVFAVASLNSSRLVRLDTPISGTSVHGVSPSVFCTAVEGSTSRCSFACDQLVCLDDGKFRFPLRKGLVKQLASQGQCVWVLSDIGELCIYQVLWGPHSAPEVFLLKPRTRCLGKNIAQFAITATHVSLVLADGSSALICAGDPESFILQNTSRRVSVGCVSGRELDWTTWGPYHDKLPITGSSVAELPLAMSGGLASCQVQDQYPSGEVCVAERSRVLKWIDSLHLPLNVQAFNAAQNRAAKYEARTIIDRWMGDLLSVVDSRKAKRIIVLARSLLQWTNGMDFWRSIHGNPVKFVLPFVVALDSSVDDAKGMSKGVSVPADVFLLEALMSILHGVYRDSQMSGCEEAEPFWNPITHKICNYFFRSCNISSASADQVSENERERIARIGEAVRFSAMDLLSSSLSSCVRDPDLFLLLWDWLIAVGTSNGLAALITALVLRCKSVILQNYATSHCRVTLPSLNRVECQGLLNVARIALADFEAESRMVGTVNSILSHSKSIPMLFDQTDPSIRAAAEYPRLAFGPESGMGFGSAADIRQRIWKSAVGIGG